eukprot:5698001-Amphidinium_carterae.1
MDVVAPCPPTTPTDLRGSSQVDFSELPSHRCWPKTLLCQLRHCAQQGLCICHPPWPSYIRSGQARVQEPKH